MIRWLRQSKLLFVLLLTISLVIGYTYVKDPAIWPIKHVHIATKLSHVQPIEVKATILPYMVDSFFMIRMGALQQELLGLPWIEKVHIERIWPDTLKISIIEQTAVVRWQDTGFINGKGELFDPKMEHNISLPRLSGFEANYKEVFAAYQRLNAKLAEEKLSIVELDLSPRSAWSALLDNGMWVYLGQDDIDMRLSRFIKAMPWLNLDTPHEMYIDLRYTNGLVLGYKNRKME